MKNAKPSSFELGRNVHPPQAGSMRFGNRFWFSYKARFQDWPQLAWVWANSMDISKSLKDPCVKWVGTLKSAHIHWNHQKVRRPSKKRSGWQKVYPTKGLPQNNATMESPGMAASRLLGAAAACAMLVSFAAGHRKSYWNGYIKAAIVICHEIFSILGLVIFSNSFYKVLHFFGLASKSGFGAAISDTIARSSIVFEGLKVWKFRCLKVWRSESLDVWKFGCLKIWKSSESFDVWKFESLNVWTSGCLKVWMSENLNVWKSECRQSTGRHCSCSAL